MITHHSRSLHLQKATYTGALMLTAVSSAFAQQDIKATPPHFHLDATPHVIVPKITVLPDGHSMKLPNGKVLPLTYHDSGSKGFQKKQAPAINQGAVRGSAGAKQGDISIPSVGSKGEVIGLAFHNGLFVPPHGERIQPALAAVAQSRLRSLANSPNLPGGIPQASIYGIIQFNGHVTDATKAALTSLGVELLGYYPNAASLARIPANSLAALASIPNIVWVGHPNADQKMHRDLVSKLTPMAEVMGTKQKVLVSFFTYDTAGAMRSDLSTTGAKLGYYDKGIAVQAVEADSATITKMVNQNSVLFIEPDRDVHTMNEFGTPAIDGDYLWGNQAPNSGTQVKLGLLDTGWYAYHTDFNNILSGVNGWLGYSLISGESWDNDLNGHGTHVAGTMVGEGRGNYRYRGVAADFYSRNDGNNPDVLLAQVLNSAGSGSFSTIIQGMDLLDSGSGVAGYKRQVWNASIGGGGYPSDAPSRKVDQTFGDNILACIAAGNSGPGYNTIGAPGCAKGAMTVGAIYSDDYNGSSNYADQITSFSSRGPGDPGVGRVSKPDVTAPGAYIDSVKHGTTSDYLYDWAGTSMATPHVTGLAAGLMGHYPGFPAWNIKSLIMANAIDLGYDRNTQGLGKVDAYISNWGGPDGSWYTWWWANGGTGDVKYVDYYLDHPVAELRFVMCYPDPASAAGVANVLVNDLDLGIQYSATNGGLSTSWSYNWGDTGYDPTSVVKISNASAGYYRIKIHSYNVPTGSQAWGVTMKWIDSKVNPQLTAYQSVPYSVMPNSSFWAYGDAYPDAFVGSSIEGYISLSGGLTRNETAVRRQSDPSGTEWLYLTSGAYYDLNHVNMGSAPQWSTREAAWYLTAPGYEGTETVNFNARSWNSYGASSSANVIIDGTPPAISGIEGRHWTSSDAVDVYATVQDTLAGLDPSSTEYRYSTDGGSTWSSWAGASCTGVSRSTSPETISIPGVPFGQNSASLNLLQLYVVDVTGNSHYQTTSISTPALTTLTVTPGAIPSGTAAVGKITLAGNAPTDGAVISLTNTNPQAIVPASITVPAGSSSVTFPIYANVVSAAFTGSAGASYAGITKPKTFTVIAATLKSVTLSPSIVIGGVQNSIGTVMYNGTVSSNKTVTLNSSLTSGATVLASVVILSGNSSATFPVTSHGVAANQLPVIKGTVGASFKTATLTVHPISISSLTLAPPTVVGGISSIATIVLASPAVVPLTVTMSSNLPLVANPISASVTFAAGQQTKTVTIHSFAVGSTKTATIKAVGFNTKTANLKVTP